MTNKWAIGTITLALLGSTLYFYQQLPSEIAIHFDAMGNPNRYGPKAMVFLLPSIYIGLSLMVLAICSYASSSSHYSGQKDTIYRILIGLGLLFIGIQLDILLSHFKEVQRLSWISSLGFSGFLIYGGNYLGRIEYNPIIGIRVPWTLKSKENWHATHRFGAKVFVVFGLLILGGCFWLPSLEYSIGMTLGAVLLPCVYSYFFYRRHEMK